MFDAEQFYWKAHYDYAKDLSSSWAVQIAPEPGQMMLDFMLGVRAWIRNGMKRKDLVCDGGEYSESYRLRQESKRKAKP